MKLNQIKGICLTFITSLLITGCALLPKLTAELQAPRSQYIILHTEPAATTTHFTVEKTASASTFWQPNQGVTYQHSPKQGVATVNDVQKQGKWHQQAQLAQLSIDINLQTSRHCLTSNNKKALISQCLSEELPANQLDASIELLQQLIQANPQIKPQHILSQTDINPKLASHNTTQLPWQQLYHAGIGAWYQQERVLHYWQMFSKKLPTLAVMQQGLKVYGYPIKISNRHDQQTTQTLLAFNQHFVPNLTQANYNSRSAAALFALVDRYYPEQLDKLLTNYHQQNISDAKPVFQAKFGQVDQIFPTPKHQRSSRKLVNDRTTFKAYQGRGEIIIENIDAESAEIEVNGQTLNIAKPLIANQGYRYSLKRRTIDGINTLKVTKVSPEGASLRIRIPYPSLQTAATNSKINFQQVDKLIAQDIEAGFPGAVLAVVHKGKLIKHTAYGNARVFDNQGVTRETPIPMHTETLFDLASNTKMFATNWALMKLATEGKLDVTKQVSHYLPDYKGSGRETRTVYDLLTHSAGYAPQVQFHRKDNKLGEAFFSNNKAYTEQLILSQVPFVNSRATTHKYSDTDYMLLGMLVERITGLPLDKYLENWIYRPLGLTNTLFNPLQKGKLPSQVAATEINGTTRGGRINFDNVREYVLQGEVHDEKAFHAFAGVAGHAGLFSTAHDMAVMLQVMLNDGGYGEQQLFSPQVVDQFIKPTDTNASYGLGWRRNNRGQLKWHFGPYAGSSAYGHTGWTGTVTVIDPEYDLGIVLLTNLRHTPVVEKGKGYDFTGKAMETGKYGSVISLVYEAITNSKAK